GNPVTASTSIGNLVVYAGMGDESNAGNAYRDPHKGKYGLLWSNNGGKTWFSAGAGKLLGLDIRSIVPSRVDPKTIFLAAQNPIRSQLAARVQDTSVSRYNAG